VISVFKALQRHQLTTHDNYNYNCVIFAYTRPPYWTKLNLLMSSVQFGRKPNRKRVCGSHWTGQVKITTVLNQTEPNRTGTGQNHASRMNMLARPRIVETSAARKAIINDDAAADACCKHVCRNRVYGRRRRSLHVRIVNQLTTKQPTVVYMSQCHWHSK